MEPRMHVCFACDDRYAPHLDAVIRSVAGHLFGTEAAVSLVSDGVSRENADRIGRLCDRLSIGFDLIEIGDSLSGLAVGDGYLTRAALGRLFIPEVLQAEKVIYLDVDTVCTAPLRRLWDSGIGDGCAAMVESPWSYYEGHKRTIGLDPRAPYFNSGVMVMDVRRLREIGFFERAIEVARDDPSLLRFADQDIVNVVLRGKVTGLHPRWNVAAALFQWRPGHTVSYGAGEVRDAIERPSVVHFTGSRKPWHPDCTHPYAHVFRAYGR